MFTRSSDGLWPAPTITLYNLDFQSSAYKYPSSHTFRGMENISREPKQTKSKQETDSGKFKMGHNKHALIRHRDLEYFKSGLRFTADSDH